FKKDIIESNLMVSKIKNKGGRKAAEILARLNPNLSVKLFSKIKEINPEYAEHINEHFYTFDDLLRVDRTNLSKFLATFNPIVVAFSLKGVELSVAEKILEKCEPWLAKAIRLEMDCMGPVTLAEIEEAQKGIMDHLHKSIDSGEIKLWKDK
ncbi:MAG: endoflagellar motor switch protein, partial [Leptospiraceae bacterium]|nr:endoflagellar motor switch protein [Leptospiraceae bacterium]